ncbi:hypothetical protein H9Q08_17605 [Chryseobacterium sp. PS-8]|uniref:NUMOD4 domain-containing protein n=1 Tax=Chryseobacterium indicum TaxID=2766954 RepID=A0ABS9C956_9FLAO|nr:NUMOD4 domain-containing protein [Chryseobacterium sp. PS-8]MCF2221106.1 hypothetical protein [Chryseobacterium sp. PS-8]
MKLPAEFEDSYVKEVLYNTSLKDLPDEKWKLIEGFENYAVSNYGRVKSLARWSHSPKGNERKLPDLIMKLIFNKVFNKHLHRSFYNVFCSLTIEGKRYRRSVSRFVYYHFVENFDLNDRSFIISYKDGNSLNTHCKNLEKITNYERAVKSMQNNRAEISEMKFQKPISQYTVEGEWIADFESAILAEEMTGIAYKSILSVVKRKRTTAGGFLWFLQNNIPKKEDFIVDSKSSISRRIFNKPLWERLNKPSIDMNNLPPCMDLSLQDLPGEEWKPIPGFEHQYLISNKGRVKRLGSWTSNKRAFWKEQIMRIMADVKTPDKCYFYIVPNLNGKTARIAIPRVMYHCFVEEFDLNDKTMLVVNQNQPLWNIDLTKLLLRSMNLMLEEKRNKKSNKQNRVL